MTILVEDDGFVHPETEDEIIALVRDARAKGLKVRVCGSGHAPGHAVHSDPHDGIVNKVRPRHGAPGSSSNDDSAGPPRRTGNVNIRLDRLGPGRTPGVTPVGSDVFEADAGMVLGSDRADAPNDDTPRGLFRVLYEDHGRMLATTGGIAHQTVGGFIATASAGGTLQTSVSNLVRGVTLIDGTGRRVVIDERHRDFHAVVPHLGLLGVVTKVRLKCTKAFMVRGTQTISTPSEADFDLFGDGDGARRPSLVSFLETEHFARIEWWPQRGCERLRVLTGKPAGPAPAPKQLEMFKAGDQRLAGTALTALGNVDDPDRMRHQLAAVLGHEPRAADEGTAADAPSELRRMGLLGRWIAIEATAATPAANGSTDKPSASSTWRERIALMLGPKLLRWCVPSLLPFFFRRLLDEFLPSGEAKEFHDHAWRALPMDDEVDDVYLPTEFTEIWVPLVRSAEVTQALKAYFDEPRGKRAAFERAGLFLVELYATKASPFWLDPGYTDSKDEWSEGALRINPYWFGRNPGDPAHDFFPRFWDVLDKLDVPYRLHWGKFLPRVEDYPRWPDENRARYPRWESFMAVRERYDPDDIFVNEYWRTRLGLAPRRARDENRLADLHSHYPMHVLAGRSRAIVTQRKRCRGRPWLWLDWLRCLLMRIGAHLMNFERWSGTWRVSLDGLHEARAGLVLSILYDPVYELLVMPRRQLPRAGAFDALICQIRCVEAELERADGERGRYRVVKTAAQLDDALHARQMAFVHCVEGGLLIGDSVEEIHDNVGQLAERGVAYITLAHLFYRGYATNTSAIPRLPDRVYEAIFRQRGAGLSELGRAAVTAMYAHRVMIDVTHMDGASLGATFELLDELDARHGARPQEHPVIASHAGYRFGDLDYMLDEPAIRAIARRDGVIGLILARHQLENGLDMQNGLPSRFHALNRHIEKIHEITRSYDHVCIGSDLDGFIKPTVGGVERVADLKDIGRWLRRTHAPQVADAILFGNAERVVRAALG